MEITKEDSFECAVRLIDLNPKCKPLVLDFASGTNPGGGWRGNQKGTQEESLCRRSDLGVQLESKKYPIPTDGHIYLKNISIKKDINLKEYKKPYTCGIIASELRSIAERSDQYLQNRLILLYETAIKNNHDVIVLGGWGLGAFKETDDDAGLLAKNMKIVAGKYNGKIKTTFAMYGNKRNYEIFKEIIS